MDYPIARAVHQAEKASSTAEAAPRIGWTFTTIVVPRRWFALFLRAARSLTSRLTREPAGLAVLGAAFFLALFLRQPRVLLHAELWGEDGVLWYGEANHLGLAALLIPAAGYLNSLQRLVGLLAQPLPLTWVPTLFAAVALVVQVLPAVFLVSSRMARVWPQQPARILFALLYLALPADWEIFGNLTNSQWHLALLAFLVLMSDPPAGVAGRIFDAIVLVLCGISGPFGILLTPVAAWQVLEQRRTSELWRLVVLTFPTLIQLGFLLAPHSGRSTAPLGASLPLLLRILSLRIVLPAELGFWRVHRLYQTSLFRSEFFQTAVATAGVLVVLIGLTRGSALLRKFAMFAGALLVCALLRPQTSIGQPQWPLLAEPYPSMRYFIIPILAWCAVLFALVTDRLMPLRGLGLVLLLILAVRAIPSDWREPRLAPTGFVARARTYAQAPAGARIEFPVDPPGFPPLVLTKPQLQAP